MDQAKKWVQLVAKVAEVVGAIAAAALGILGQGKIGSTDGKAAVIAALIAGAGHAVTHHANPNVTP